MISVLALCADLVTSLFLSHRSELRLRVVETPAVVGSSMLPASMFDIAMTPSLSLEAHSRRASVSFGYAPQLTLPLSTASDHSAEVSPAPRAEERHHVELLHTAQAFAGWRWRRVR